MLDFLIVSTRMPRKGTVEIYPKFIVTAGSDLMIRGSDFYAVWNEEKKLWSKEEVVALQLIDKELDEYAEKHKDDFADAYVKVLHMWDSDSGSIDKWHKYVQKQKRDKYVSLDETLIFANTETVKTDYASKKLPYSFERKETPAFDELMEKLYSPTERHKIEWAIGAIISGDSKTIQKFLVMYGAPKTGKSTVIRIMQDLFDGYWSVFDSQALSSASNTFALESFRSNPLVAMQDDGDLSRLENTPKLNSIVSHEVMTVNEKFKSSYTTRFISFLIMGTNKPVKISDAKSGLLRRLIDVSPTGETFSKKKYNELCARIKFELGGIAAKCLDIYKEDPSAYDHYVPTAMMGASNDFYNFVADSYDVFKQQDSVTLKQAWEMYKLYCEEARVYGGGVPRRVFQEELKNYFRNFCERKELDDGTRVRSWYGGFMFEKFEYTPNVREEKHDPPVFELNCTKSIFDEIFKDCPAQYANLEENERPMNKWGKVTTTLKDIDTSKLHYMLGPDNLIFVDFDLKDEDGKKCYELNAKAASLWPPTYCELSKGGQGIHAYYFYDGDVGKLSTLYSKNIEIKVPTGKSAIRRKVIRCNDLPIATINSGLPLKEESKMVNYDGIRNEKALITKIKKNLRKEYADSTKCSIDYIYNDLEEAYKTGMKYDVSSLHSAVLSFAAQSSNQSDYCIKLVNKMHFKSDEETDSIEEAQDISYPDMPFIFFDTEVFKNLFVLCWKFDGEDKVYSMINPTPQEIINLSQYKLIGFNNRAYDNQICYARMCGYNNLQLYNLSQSMIVKKERNPFGINATSFSYTDIYDFASAGNKKSLKKLEYEMKQHGIPVKHQELPLPWDEPVPEEKWPLVVEYCCNDVRATEAAFHYLKADWMARKILAKITDSTVNDTTNTLTTRLIFGRNRHPNGEFVYTDLSTIFPGYSFSNGKSSYRGENPGEGGYVYAVPGVWGNVALLDIASMHPNSIITLNLFGDRYTAVFQELVNTRIAVKHKDRDYLRKAFDGKLAEFADAPDEDLAALADALKTAINSVYGLTSAGFDNPFRDKRNIDNIVAKRGALFMINLKHEVLKRGYTVAHIKTDSIKIPDATPEIIQFVMDYGKQYGYTFEHEATYDKMCLVNDSVYIAQYATVEKCEALYGTDYVNSSPDICKKNKKKPGDWDATGAQFQHPYVFKELFSHEEITFDDMCEMKSVSTALYLDMNEDLPDVSREEKELDGIKKKYRYPEGFLEDTPEEVKERYENLREYIPLGHDYHFIGKSGLFVPVKDGYGGGILVRESIDKYGDKKYSSATGADGYRWMESEMVETMEDPEEIIDISLARSLVDKAVAAIEYYADSDWFRSGEEYVKGDMHILPF